MSDEAPVAVTPKARKPRKVTVNQNGTRHSLTIQFTESEDIDLYERLEGWAKADRRPFAQYVLLCLHKAFQQPMENASSEATSNKL